MSKEKSSEKCDFCDEKEWEKKFEKIGEKLENKFDCWDSDKKWHRHSGSFMGGFYGLGFLAVLVYYIQHSDSFWMGVLGILKACVWPAMLVYKVFTMLNM